MAKHAKKSVSYLDRAIGGLVCAAAVVFVAAFVSFQIGLFSSVGVGVASANDSAALIDAVRDANWRFPEELDEGSIGNVSNDRESSVEPEIATSEGGSQCVAGEILVSLSGAVDEQGLRAALQESGVTASDISLVSKSLDDGEVLVKVSYEGDASPDEVVDSLSGNSVVMLAEPNYVYTFCDFEEAEESPALKRSAGDAAEEDLFEEAEEAPAPDNADLVGAIDAEFDCSIDEASFDSTTNDPGISNQWALGAISAYGAWNIVKANGTVTVAVLDSGVDYDHPDLDGNLILGSYAKNTASEAYGAAAVDDTLGHGTHVSGIIAAEANNSIGVVGASYNAKILPIKVSNGESIFSSDIIEALDYVVALKTNPSSPEFLKNIRVINMSLGGTEYQEVYAQAVKRARDAGIILVAASGNANKGAGQSGTFKNAYYPASYEGVIGVSALGETLDRAPYSNYGNCVDIAAPGSNIYSTAYAFDESTGARLYYTKMSGTSMAAPFVSAAAALVFAANPSLTEAEASAVLLGSAKPKGDAAQYGSGVLNMKQAVSDARKVPISRADVTPIPFQAYTGSAITPSVVVTFGSTVLEEGVDYTVSYANNVSRGEAKATVTGMGDYCGVTVVKFRIGSYAEYELSEGEKEWANLSIPYSAPAGSQVPLWESSDPEVVVVGGQGAGGGIAEVAVKPVSAGEAELRAFVGKDQVGAIKVVVTPAAKISISDAVVSGLDASYVYTGAPIEPSFVVTRDDVELQSGIDFTCSFSNNVNAGEALLTLIGIGEYEGSAEVGFTIERANISSVSGLSVSDQEYTGLAVKPALALALGNHALVEGSDYEVSCENNVEIGQAEAVVTGIGNFEGAVVVPFAIIAASAPGPEAWLRLAGSNRFLTAQAIAQEGFSGTGGVAVIATGLNYADALAATSLAGVYKAPVLLTMPGYLSAEAAEELDRLAPSKVIVVGGAGVVSDAVIAEVKGMLPGVAVDRVWGANRFDTSAAVYRYIENNPDVSWSGDVILATGLSFADALAVSPYAYWSRTPILLVNPAQGLGAEAAGVVLAGDADDRFGRVIAVGGVGCVSEAAYAQVEAAHGSDEVLRLAGSDRFATGVEVAKFAASEGMSYDGAGVATGMDFPDALAGAALCGAKGSVLLLVNGAGANLGPVGDLLSAKAASVDGGYVFGGEGVVTPAIVAMLEAAIG